MPTWDSPRPTRSGPGDCGADRWRGARRRRAALAGATDAELWEHAQQRPRGPGQAMPASGWRRSSPSRCGTDRGSRRRARCLDPNTLTLGFARRFATYKRPDLLLRDPDRLVRILDRPDPPVQLVVAGKAHPADEDGRRWSRPGSTSRVAPRCARACVFLADYDLLARASISSGRRPVDQHAAAALGGVRHQRDEGAGQRRPEPLRARRLVGGGVYAGRGLVSGHDNEQTRRRGRAAVTPLERRDPSFYTRDPRASLGLDSACAPACRA